MLFLVITVLIKNYVGIDDRHVQEIVINVLVGFSTLEPNHVVMPQLVCMVYSPHVFGIEQTESGHSTSDLAPSFCLR